MEKVSGMILGGAIDKMDASSEKNTSARPKRYLDEQHKLDRQGWGPTGKGGMYHRKHFSFAPGPIRLTSTKELMNHYAKQAGTPLLKPTTCLLAWRPSTREHHVRCSGRVTSIIDWECVGCYPFFLERIYGFSTR